MDAPQLPEIRPNLAETFDLQARIDGFDATVVHLPRLAARVQGAGPWLERLRIDLCLIAFVFVGVAYTLGCLFVLTVAPLLSPIALAAGMLVANAADVAIDSLEPASRRLGDQIARVVQQKSRLRLDASRLHLGAESWPLDELSRLEADGSTLRVVPVEGRPVVLLSDHSPWACARLCVLVNAQIDWNRQGGPQPPPALAALKDRARRS